MGYMKLFDVLYPNNRQIIKSFLNSDSVNKHKNTNTVKKQHNCMMPIYTCRETTQHCKCF